MAVWLLAALLGSAIAVQVTDLRVEHLTRRDALGLGTNPRFSWTVYDPEFQRGLSQSSYRITVVNQYTQQTVWDSGLVASANTNLIPYRSSVALMHSTSYSWHVYVTTTKGLSATSQNSTFTTGLFTNGDWSASWITGGPNRKQLRSEFNLTRVPSHAVVHVSGLGYFELHVNGVRVGDHMLDVGWTDYAKRVYYVTHNVGTLLHPGRNVLAVTLGNSWFACAGGLPGCMNTPPQLLLQLVGWTANAYSILSRTNTADWKTSAGPIVYDSLYNGEIYNSLLETPGWMRPNFDDRNWSPATAAGFTPALLSPQLFPPIRKLLAFQPRSMTIVRNNVYVIDFGQNMAGIVRLVVHSCARGHNITMRHAEVLQHPPYGPSNGEIYVGNLRGAKATDIYTCRGDETEVYEPRFTQHGFRYAEISGLVQVPTEADITAFEMHTDVQQTGSFSSSAHTELLDSIQHAIVWGQKSNLMSVATDCPQRDERRGWTGDAALTAEEASFNFDMAAFYSNWLNIYRDDQNPDGSSNDYVPSLGETHPGAPNWQTAYPTLIWAMLRYRGDVQLVANQYPAMQKYSEFFKKQYERTGLKNFFTGYGDWVPPPPAPKANDHLVAAFSYMRDLGLLAELADAIGNSADAATFRARLAPLCKEFNSAFYNSASKTYGSGLQTEQSMGIWLNCVPEGDLDAAMQHLLSDISKHGDHVTTGILGWKVLLEVLTMHNRGDVALKLNLAETYPSFGYMLKGVGNQEPATTVWELWDSDRGDAGMNSRNHIMFGTNGAWFYKGVAGIEPAAGTAFAGYKGILVGPQPSVVGAYNLTSAAASVYTPQGSASVRWQIGSSTSCGVSNEDAVLQLSCPSGVFDKVVFASFGDATGSCVDKFRMGQCNAAQSVDVVSKACLGKPFCSIHASNAVFGPDPCFGTLKSLSVELHCTGLDSDRLFLLSTTIPVGATGLVSVPVLPDLSQTTANLVVTESGRPVWRNGTFEGNVPGITGGRLQKFSNGGASVQFTTTNGAFNFVGTDSTTFATMQQVVSAVA